MVRVITSFYRWGMRFREVIRLPRIKELEAREARIWKYSCGILKLTLSPPFHAVFLYLRISLICDYLAFLRLQDFQYSYIFCPGKHISTNSYYLFICSFNLYYLFLPSTVLSTGDQMVKKWVPCLFGPNV